MARVISDSNAPRVRTREADDGWRWELFETSGGPPIDSAIVGYTTQLSAWEAGNRVLDLWLLSKAPTEDVWDTECPKVPEANPAQLT